MRALAGTVRPTVICAPASVQPQRRACAAPRAVGVREKRLCAAVAQRRRRAAVVCSMLSQSNQAVLSAGVSGASAAVGGCLLTTSITASTVSLALDELREAEAAGADVVELRVDFLDSFAPSADLPTLLAGTRLPAIVTYRPNWEGGRYAGPEDVRLRTLWLAVELGAAFVDVELKAAAQFFAAAPAHLTQRRSPTRIIVSSHNYAETPSLAALLALHTEAAQTGADIVKIATMATRLVDVARLEALLAQTRAVPTIALGMGEAGLVRVAAKLHAPPGLT